MSEENQTGRENCYICGGSNADILERHHIVPRRYGGSDEPVNLVDVCPTCHRALETLYDERFYRVLGIGERDEVVQYVSGDLADRLEQLELGVSVEIRRLKTEIENDYITEFDEADIRQAMRDHAASKRETAAADGLEQKERIRMVREIIEEYESENKHGAPIDTVFEQTDAAGIERSKAEHVIEKLDRQGDVVKLSSDDGDEYLVVV